MATLTADEQNLLAAAIAEVEIAVTWETGQRARKLQAVADSLRTLQTPAAPPQAPFVPAPQAPPAP